MGIPVYEKEGSSIGLGSGALITPEALGLPCDIVMQGGIDKDYILIEERSWLSHPQVKQTLLEKYGLIIPNQSKRSGKLMDVSTDDGWRDTHLYVLGGSGSGKTRALRSWIYQDVRRGKGLGVIDPHGDLIEEILTDIPDRRRDDLIVIDPTDDKIAFGYNPLELIEGGLPKERLIDELIIAFKRIWSDSWGPRMEDIMRNSIHVLIDNGLTLYEMPYLLTSAACRAKMLENVSDPMVRLYFEERFPKSAKEREIWIESTLNKISAFMSNPTIAMMLGQQKSSVDFRKVMDEGKILLINLSKGKLGEQNAYLLGALIVTKLYSAAISRADTTKDNRRLWLLYVDEFQNYATSSFENILSEARKYGLGLIMANQNLTQIDEKLKSSILANTGINVYFRTSAEDAEEVVKQTFPVSGSSTKYVEIALGVLKGTYFRDVIYTGSSNIEFMEPVVGFSELEGIAGIQVERASAFAAPREGFFLREQTAETISMMSLGKFKNRFHGTKLIVSYSMFEAETLAEFERGGFYNENYGMIDYYSNYSLPDAISKVLDKYSMDFSTCCIFGRILNKKQVQRERKVGFFKTEQYSEEITLPQSDWKVELVVEAARPFEVSVKQHQFWSTADQYAAYVSRMVHMPARKALVKYRGYEEVYEITTYDSSDVITDYDKVNALMQESIRLYYRSTDVVKAKMNSRLNALIRKDDEEKEKSVVTVGGETYQEIE